MQTLTLDSILWIKKTICFQLIIYLLVYNSVSSTVSLGLLKPGNLQKFIISFCCSLFLNYDSSGETFLSIEVANRSPQDRNKLQSQSCEEIACWSLSACCSGQHRGLHHLSLLRFLSRREVGAYPCQPSWCCPEPTQQVCSSLAPC